MYHELEARFRKRLANYISSRYGQDPNVATERPPKVAMGELSSPVCFELAKLLKRPPRQIAQEIANSMGAVARSRQTGSRGRGLPERLF